MPSSCLRLRQSHWTFQGVALLELLQAPSQAQAMGRKFLDSRGGRCVEFITVMQRHFQSAALLSVQFSHTDGPPVAMLVEALG